MALNLKSHYIGAFLSVAYSCTYAQQTADWSPPVASQFVFSSPARVMLAPEHLLDTWGDTPLPTDQYSLEEVAIQQQINHQLVDFIVTNSRVSNATDHTSIDHEPITPYTWKWVDLELKQKDGSISEINIRRPNWWIRELGAHQVGNTVYLDMPEMGITGMALVKDIRANLLDTRFSSEMDSSFRPITGKFVHESDQVFEVDFLDSNESLGVTGSHLIWSLDRAGYVPAESLQPGERVQTHDGFIVVKTIQRKPGKHKVFNLEVYRDHHFFVSMNAVLAHNECWNEHWYEVLTKWFSRSGPDAKMGLPVSITKDGVTRIYLKGKDALNIPDRATEMLYMERKYAKAEGANKVIIKIDVEGVDDARKIGFADELRGEGFQVIEFKDKIGKWIEGTREGINKSTRPPTPDDVGTIPPPRRKQ